MCQIRVFPPLRRNCAISRDRRRSWIVSKRPEDLNWRWNICQITRTHTIRKNQSHKYHKFYYLCAIRSQSHKWLNLWYSWLWFFRAVRVRVIWRMFQLQFMMEKGGPTFWHYKRHSTISRPQAIYSPRPKSANLAQVGINAYDTAGNLRVKLYHFFRFKLYAAAMSGFKKNRVCCVNTIEDNEKDALTFLMTILVAIRIFIHKFGTFGLVCSVISASWIFSSIIFSADPFRSKAKNDRAPLNRHLITI